MMENWLPLTAALGAGILLIAGLSLTTRSEPIVQTPKDRIDVVRHLPEEIEKGETLTVSLEIQRDVQKVLEIEEEYSGVLEGSKSLRVRKDSSRSKIYYRLEAPNRTGKIFFEGAGRVMELMGDEVVEVVRGETLLDLEASEKEVDVSDLIPENIEEMEISQRSEASSEELVEAIEDRVSANYRGAGQDLYISATKYRNISVAERSVNRIASQQIEARNEDRIERVTLESGKDALKVESIEDIEIVNWGHGRLVFQVQAENPLRYAERMEEIYRNEN